MLASLSIRDIVLIDRLDLTVVEGLTVLTGETGAGKSIMLDALGLALGARGDGTLVRTGAKQGTVTALFDLDPGHVAGALLEENGIPFSGELLLRRVQNADGRTRAFVNDEPVSVQLLKGLARSLVEIHGQHDDRALLDPEGHLLLVDAFGQLDDEVDQVEAAHARWQSARRALVQHEAAVEKARRERDYLEHAVAELREADPEEGEEERLSELRTLMMNAEKFTEDLQEAEQALSGDGTVDGRLNAALRKLERAADRAAGRLDAATAAIERALVEMSEARHAVAAAIEAIEFDPRTLERTEERLFALRALARKHNVQVDGLVKLKTDMENQLSALENDEERLAALTAAETEARAGYVASCETLGGKRRAAAAALDARVVEELAPLKLERARFETRIESVPVEQGTARGCDRAEFMIAANPGVPPGPLMKVASGGELARFMLALKVALAEKGSAPCLIFDEIDTGVGGAVAEAIGVRLSRLAHGGLQVLAVTHSPQVAARADAHILISKQGDVLSEDERVVTRIEQLDNTTRREEIARMLAGAKVTDEARAAADRLIGSEA